MTTTTQTRMNRGDLAWIDGIDWSVAIMLCGDRFVCRLYSSDHETVMGQSATLTTEAGARRWAARTIARMDARS